MNSLGHILGQRMARRIAPVFLLAALLCSPGGCEWKAQHSEIALLQRRATPPRDHPSPPPVPVAVGPVKRRWAIVVGVSEYKAERGKLQSLQYADRDATAFRDFLVSKAGGSFPSKNVLLLTNKAATTAGLRKALFSFAKSAIKEDLLVIFFSGHGASDPDRPKNLYLLTYDTDPSDIAATAFPMDDIKKALANTIEAHRVVVLADACHSGGVAGDVKTKGVRIGEQNEAMVKYWSQLSKTAHGRVIFTSNGLSSELMYRAVPSPSMLGFVAMTISLTWPVRVLFTRSFIVKSLGSTPSRGAIWPLRTW